MIVEDIELISLFEANLFKICNRVKVCLFFRVSLQSINSNNDEIA